MFDRLLATIRQPVRLITGEPKRQGVSALSHFKGYALMIVLLLHEDRAVERVRTRQLRAEHRPVCGGSSIVGRGSSALGADEVRCTTCAEDAKAHLDWNSSLDSAIADVHQQLHILT